MEGLVCSAWINWNKVLVVRFRKESMQKSVPIDAADMRTVKKDSIISSLPGWFPQFWQRNGIGEGDIGFGQKNLLKW